jgi:hypothetical protein
MLYDTAYVLTTIELKLRVDIEMITASITY